MDELINRAAKDLVNSKFVVALTGAGISVESGVPPFRGKGGVWEKIDPMEYAHIDAFMRDPAKVWDVLIKGMKGLIDTAKPNDAHMGLAELERMGLLKTIITQNIDGLHQVAGNTDVIEFHGNFAWQRCIRCDNMIETRKIDLSEIPPKCECGGVYRPDCVFFGEMIPPEHLMRSKQVSVWSDVMLVIGTSAMVQPAAYMPVVAKESGTTVIEINPERTPLTDSISDYLIMGKGGEVMNGIVREAKKMLG